MIKKSHLFLFAAYSVLFVLFFCIPGPGLSQAVSYSPTSFKAWGSTLQTQKLDIRLYAFQYTYIQVNDTRIDRLGSPVSQVNHGLFFIPRLEKKGWFISGGFGFFAKQFANENGTRFNFTFEAGKTFDVNIIRLGAKYSHISNGSTGKQNHGLDNIAFIIELPLSKN